MIIDRVDLESLQGFTKLPHPDSSLEPCLEPYLEPCLDLKAHLLGYEQHPGPLEAIGRSDAPLDRLLMGRSILQEPVPLIEHSFRLERQSLQPHPRLLTAAPSSLSFTLLGPSTDNKTAVFIDEYYWPISTCYQFHH